MLDFLPAFDFPTAERIEGNAQKNATQAGIDHRVALTVLTKSSTELRQAVAEAPEAFLSGAESLRKTIEWHQGSIELLTAAEARLLAALSDRSPETVEGAQRRELENAHDPTQAEHIEASAEECAADQGQ